MRFHDRNGAVQFFFRVSRGHGQADAARPGGHRRRTDSREKDAFLNAAGGVCERLSSSPSMMGMIGVSLGSTGIPASASFSFMYRVFSIKRPTKRSGSRSRRRKAASAVIPVTAEMDVEKMNGLETFLR